MTRATFWLLCSAACGPLDGADAEPVARPEAWRPIAGPDPFGNAGDVYCEPTSWGPTEFDDQGTVSFEIDTTFCPWLTVEQPSTVEIRRHDRLTLRMWHFDLTAPDVADATIGLAVGDEVVWTDDFSIPRPGAWIEAAWDADRVIPAGTPLRVHVDNHGANTYDILEVGVARRVRGGGG